MNQSIKSWYKILDWNALPCFSSCHEMQYADLLSNYMLFDEIALLEENMKESLLGGTNNSCIRFQGLPGAGKTSFLYYLMKKSIFENSELNNKYSFYIFHANKANDEEYAYHVKCEIIEAWRIFYTQTGNSDVFRLIDHREENKKAKINELVKYYKNNPELFSKSLIFIIDDVDKLDPKRAYQIAHQVFSDIELRRVPKWISIREATFDSYSQEIKNFLREFFPKIYTLPHSSLHSIISYRISAVSYGKGKNPFSARLCDEIILNLVDGNMRLGLSALQTILENIPPKATKSYSSEEYVQQYIEKTSVHTLLDIELLKNIHSNQYRISQYPYASDIIMCALYSTDVNIIFGAISDIMKRKSRISAKWTVSGYYKARKTDFNHVLKLLKADKIIKVDGGRIYLTLAGKVLAKYIFRDSYINKTLKNIPDIEKDETYDSFSWIDDDYEERIQAQLAWRNQYEE